jgi:hypothetical protein
MEEFIILILLRGTVALRPTQLLTEMGTMKIPGGKGQLEGEADNLTTTCVSIV